MCVLDVHVGQTDVPTGSPGDVPRRSLPPSPMSPGDGEMLLSLLVPLMGKSSRRSGLTEMGHSPDMVRTTVKNFPWRDATPGDRCKIDLDVMLVTEFPRTDATPGEKYVFGLDSRTVPNSPRLDATPGDRYVIGCEVMTVPIFPRTSATPGEMCTMDVGFRPDVNVLRTSSNPGEKSAGELGCRSVLGFSQVDSAQSKCGAVELDFRWANCPPGKIGAEECDYIMPAPLAGSQTWNAYHIKEGTVSWTLVLAGRCLRPVWPEGHVCYAVLVDLHAGDTGGPWRDVAAIRPCRDAAPGYACWPCWPVGDVAPIRL